MAKTSGKNESLILILTIIHVTDFIGANWFYLGNIAADCGKIVLSGLLLWIYLYFVITRPGLEAIAIYFIGVIIFAISVIWWLIDVYLLCIKEVYKK